MPGSNIASIDNLQLSNAAQTAYTTPANTKSVIQKLTATSQEASAARLLTIYKVPAGDVAGAAYIIVYKMSIPPGANGSGITDIPGMVNQVLEAGTTLQAVLDSGTTVYLNGSLLETS